MDKFIIKGVCDVYILYLLKKKAPYLKSEKNIIKKLYNLFIALCKTSVVRPMDFCKNIVLFQFKKKKNNKKQQQSNIVRNIHFIE